MLRAQQTTEAEPMSKEGTSALAKSIGPAGKDHLVGRSWMLFLSLLAAHLCTFSYESQSFRPKMQVSVSYLHRTSPQS